MSMMWGLNFFFGLQIKQDKKEIFLNQCQYAKELVKKFRIDTSKISQILMSGNCKIEKDEADKDVDQKNLYKHD